MSFRRRWKALPSALFVSALCLSPITGSAKAASSFDAGIKRISGEDLFPFGCGVPGVQAGAETGPALAVNPADPRNLIVAWEQDTSQSYNSLTVIVGASKDGGRTWRQVRLPGISRCTGGEASYASEPSLAIGPDGIAYLSLLGADPSTSAVQVSRSIDGGLSWEKPVLVAPPSIAGAIAADPVNPTTAYLATTRSGGIDGNDILFSRSTDGGRTWSTTAVETPLGGTVTEDLVVLGDGTLLLVLLQAPNLITARIDPDSPVMVVRSTDKGKTWSPAVELGQIADRGLPHDPEKGKPGEAEGRVLAPALPTATAGRDGTAYVAWPDLVSKDSSRILFARSTDKGVGWSVPQALASVPAQAFLPALATATDGTVGAVWADFRKDKPGDAELTTDIWFAHSHDQGAQWQQAHLAGPFDMRRAPEHFGSYIGFGQGLAALSSGFGAAFVQAPPRAADGPSDIYFTRLTSRLPRLHLSVRPGAVAVGKRVRLVFRATTTSQGKRVAVASATVRLAGSKARTDKRGRATIVKRFSTPGVYRARAGKRGFVGGSVSVRARR